MRVILNRGGRTLAILLSLACWAGLGGLAGCDEGGGGGGPKADAAADLGPLPDIVPIGGTEVPDAGGEVVPVVQALSIAPTEARLDIDQSYKLTAIALFDDGRSIVMQEKLRWISSEPEVARVDAAGLVTGLTAGATDITVSLDGITSPPARITVLPAEPPPPDLAGLKVLPPSMALNIGQQFQLAAYGRFDDGRDLEMTGEVQWRSSEPDVVSVDADGLATALDEGAADITASLGDITSPPARISVSGAALVAIELEPSSATLYAASDEGVNFSAFGLYTDGARLKLGPGLVWTSDHADIAFVDDMGLVMPGLLTGMAHISAALGPIASAPAVVFVLPSEELTAIELAPEAPSMLVRDKLQMMATLTYADGRKLNGNLLVSWESADEAIATIDDHGLVEAMAAGETTLTARLDDRFASVMLRVQAPGPTALFLEPEEASVPAGATQQFDATAWYEDGSVRDVGAQVEWIADDPEIATIDAAGLAHGLAAGETAIRARLGEIEAVATLTVTPALLLSLQIDPAAPAPLAVGRSMTFTVSGHYSDGVARDLSANPNLVWTVSDPAVARISNAAGSRGVVTGLDDGATFVEALFRSPDGALEADPVQLTVVAAALEAVELAPVNPVIPASFTVQFRLTGRYSDDHVEDLTDEADWSSSAAGVARFSDDPDERGLVTGLAAGTSTIRGRMGDLEATTRLTVTGATLRSISVAPPSREIALGGSARFAATGNFTDGSVRDMTRDAIWSVAIEDLGRGVSVSNASDRQGLVTVAANARPSDDRVTLYATYGAIVGVAEVMIVGPRRLVGIQVLVEGASQAGGTYVLPAGFTAQARAYGTYSDGVRTFEPLDLTSLVTFTPSVGGVAVVSNSADNKGRISALGRGQVELNACHLDVCANDPDVLGQARLRVTDCAFTRLTIEPEDDTLAKGMSRQYKARAMYAPQGADCQGLPANGHDVTPFSQWFSSNPMIATVAGLAIRGLVTAANDPPSRDVRITTRFRDLEAGFELHVIDACVASITLQPGQDLSLPAGVRQTFVANARLTDGTNLVYTNEAQWQVEAANAGQLNPLSKVDGRPGVIDTARGAQAGSEGIVRASSQAGGGCEAQSAAVRVRINGNELTNIAIDPSRIDVAVGACYEFLQATGQYDGQRLPLSELAFWSSSNPAVASAGPNGRICGHAPGNVVILATYNNVSGTARVNVGGRQLQRVRVEVDPSFECGNFGGAAYAAGVDFPMKAIGEYSDGSRDIISAQAQWTSSRPAVATVSGAGHIHTVDDGTTRINARFGGLDGFLDVNVADAQLRAIDIRPLDGDGRFRIELNASRQFQAMGTYEASFGNPPQARRDACDITSLVAWGAAPQASLRIEATGLARSTATPSNAATITASLGGIVRTVNGDVIGACVRGLALRPTLASTAVGVRTQFLASSILSDGSTRDVTVDPLVFWESSNPNVALANRGEINPLAAGEVRISARYELSDEAACDDVNPPLVATATLVVRPAVLERIDVTCDRALDWPNAANALPVGLETRCLAMGFYSDGTSQEVSTTALWTSSDPRAAVVSNVFGSKGRVTTIAEGSTNIAAEQEGVRGAIALRVIGAALDGVQVSGAASIPVGFSEPYRAQALYRLGGDQRSYAITDLATWRSADPASLAIGDGAADKGLARALRTANGVEITAAFGGQTGRLRVDVLDARLDRIELLPSDATIALGLDRQYVATGYFTVGGNPRSWEITRLVQWGTTDPALATIDATGKLHARGLGRVAIVAQLGAVSGNRELQVVDKCVRSIVLDRSSQAIPAGVPLRFSVTAHYSSGPAEDLTRVALFSSSHPGRLGIPDAEGWTASADGAPAGNVTMSAWLGSADCNGRTPQADAVVRITDATLDEIAVGSEAVAVGRTVQMHAVGEYSDGSTFDITRTIHTWETGSGLIAFVSDAQGSRGLVTGVAQGRTPVVATQDVVSGEGSVTVTAAVLNAVAVQGYNSAGACRAKLDDAAWQGAGFVHPAHGFTTWARAMGTFSDGSRRDVTGEVVWTTSNAAVAQIDNGAMAGRVRTGSAGRANLTATAPNGVTHSLELEARDLLADRVILSQDGDEGPVDLALGYGAQLSLVGMFNRQPFCITEDGSYATDAPAVANVSNVAGRRGQVLSEGLGSAIVSAYVGVMNDTIQIRVRDPEIAYVEVLPALLQLRPGQSARLQAFAHFSDGTVNEITDSALTSWRSDAANIVEMTAINGILRAKAEGDAHIDACTQGVCANPAGGQDRRATIRVRP